MLSAVFMNGCVTVHDYKSKVAALGRGAENLVRGYEIAECYAMKYEDFIYLCNHLDEQRSFFRAKAVGAGVLRVTLFYCTRADRMLLVHAKKNDYCESIAVLYYAGQKVELRPNNHRARALRAAERRRWKENLKHQ